MTIVTVKKFSGGWGKVVCYKILSAVKSMVPLAKH